MAKMLNRVAIAELWLGPTVLVEERTVTSEGGEEETFYAFPGGKVETKETIRQAAAREILEETGIKLDADSFGKPEVIRIEDELGYVFRVLLQYGTKFTGDNIIPLTPRELTLHKEDGKLMPFTDEYVGRNY